MWVIYADFDFNLITFAEFDGEKPWWCAANVRHILTDAIGNGARYVYLAIRRDDPPGDMDRDEFAHLEAIHATLNAAGMDLVDCVLMGDGMISMNRLGRMDAMFAEADRAILHDRYIGSHSSRGSDPEI